MIDLNKYKEFVQAVTSDESNDTEMMILRIRELEKERKCFPTINWGSRSKCRRRRVYGNC
jgi:hypothetical protein